MLSKEQSLELENSNIAKFLGISEQSLEPFELNLLKVILMLDEYSYCFPHREQYEQLEDLTTKSIYFAAICLQWHYMINNVEMYDPADALIGEKVGRHNYSGISADALASFSRQDPTAVGLLERNGLTCNGISLSHRGCGCNY